MKIAKASAQDLEAGLMLLGLLDTLSSGYYPGDSDAAADEPLYFDDEDPKHLTQMWKRLKACLDMAPGFQGRVIGGAHTLMAPANELIDPNDDCLALHPRLATALVERERFENVVHTLLEHVVPHARETGHNAADREMAEAIKLARASVFV